MCEEQLRASVKGLVGQRSERRQVALWGDREIAKARSQFYRQIRDFFDARDFVETETPLLSQHLIPESAIEIFRTTLMHPHRGGDELYLTPSPEVYMKILISEGIGDCYQLTKSFRNAEHYSARHHAEFTMLEWYAMGQTYLDNIEATQALLRALAPSAHPESRTLFENFVEIDMRTLVQTQVGIDIADCSTYEALCEAALAAGFEDYVAASEDWEDLFNRIFISHVEPALPADQTVFLKDYPAQIPTTAKRRGTVYERWEFYMRGWEIANCYTEEAGYDQMHQLFESEQKLKDQMMTPHHVDFDYLEIFRQGFPLCSGVALGVDRLFAIHKNAPSLDAVSLFPMGDVLR